MTPPPVVVSRIRNRIAAAGQLVVGARVRVVAYCLQKILQAYDQTGRLDLRAMFVSEQAFLPGELADRRFRLECPLCRAPHRLVSRKQADGNQPLVGARPAVAVVTSVGEESDLEATAKALPIWSEEELLRGDEPSSPGAVVSLAEWRRSG